METDYSNLSLAQLKQLYERANNDLEAALLNGADWTELRDKRFVVTQLSIQIHKKRFPPASGSPADTAFRTEDGQL